MPFFDKHCNFSKQQTVNIVDAYKDPRFDPSVDDGTDFVHKTVLCMPIKNSDGLTIGVIQVDAPLLLMYFSEKSKWCFILLFVENDS